MIIRTLRFVSMLAVCILAGCAGGLRPQAPEDAAQALLALHEKQLQAHRDGDVGAFLEDWSEEMLSVNRGEMKVTHPDEMRPVFSAYFGSTDFEYYRDRQPPRVEVSEDGTLGWVAAEVEARGVSTSEDGTETPMAFASSWVSLFRYIDGEWHLVGNASSFRE